jgi:hypothetical protein
MVSGGRSVPRTWRRIGNDRTDVKGIQKTADKTTQRNAGSFLLLEVHQGMTDTIAVPMVVLPIVSRTETVTVRAPGVA